MRGEILKMESICQRCGKRRTGSVISKNGTYKILGETIHGIRYCFVCGKCGHMNSESVEILEMNAQEAIKAFRKKFDLPGEGSISSDERKLLKEKYGIPKRRK